MKKIFFIVLCFSLLGCSHIERNVGHMGKFAVPDIEAEWIQNGEPVKFEEKLWYTQDRFDVLLDSEVFLKGEHQGVPFFIE